MANFRLKKQYLNKVVIVVAKGRGYKIDSDFYQNYSNANALISENKEIGHFFEDQSGRAVTDAPKPKGKATRKKADSKKED